MLYTVRIYVSLKPTVNDPQGMTIMGGLQSLGFSGVQDVRAGKFLTLQVEAPTKKAAAGEVEEMCRKLLANPVIETYQLDVTKTA